MYVSAQTDQRTHSLIVSDGKQTQAALTMHSWLR